MSTDTASTDSDVQSDDQDNGYWSIEDESGSITLSRKSYSSYEFTSDVTKIGFDGVTEMDDGGFKLKEGHRERAIVYVTGTVAAVLDVLSHEL